MHKPSPHQTLLLGEGRISIETLRQVARERRRITLSHRLEQRLQTARAVVDRHVAQDKPVYGLTTGLGATADTRLSHAEMVAYQYRAIPARAVGVGPPLPTDAVRAMMFARLAGLAAGGSGGSEALAEALAGALNASFHPIIPSIGSIGAGDLAPLAHMGLAMIGQGEAEWGGETLPAAEALRRAGLRPVDLQHKDGHVLIVANSLSVGRGALAAHDIDDMLNVFNLAWAMSMEAFRGNVSPIDARACAARPAPGQENEAARLRALLHGSLLFANGEARRLQDPLSFRCAAPVHGAARSALDLVREALEIELTHSADNPIVLAESETILSNGNFDMTALSLRFEMLGQALAHMGTLSARRANKLLATSFSGLPRFLSPLGASWQGFQTVQKTISALEADVRHRAQPVPLTLLPVSDSVEDHAANTPATIAKTHEMVERLAYLAAIEMIIAAQAIDMRKLEKLGEGAERGYQTIRRHVTFLEEDRALGPAFDTIAQAIFDGAFA